ncbi:MAG: DUF1800 family protein [Saprospiraceae bacterium]
MFQPYTGPWDHRTAAHLLRRTIFGPTKERIQQAVDEGLEGSIATLFADPAPVDPPVYYDFEDDPLAGIGETWTDKYLNGNITGIYFARSKTMWSWWFQQMARNDQTITEKLTLFWHNHFPITDAGHANMNWTYLTLLRENGLGDFKELVKRITVDRSMLIYLSGTSNFADEPNENYARELLELFTIGKGDLVAPGDYTNYTEQDIAEMARVLTGWWTWVAESESNPNPPATFEPWNGMHDTGSKQLSHRFDNQVIENAGADEYKNLIDIIFEKEECARHICRRLYKWFVHYEFNDTIENEIIAPMAQVLIDNDYQIQPALEALLRSQHFYDEAMRGCMIKSTLDFFFSSYNTLKVVGPSDPMVEYDMWVGWYWEFQELGQAIFEVPSVAGWTAYHQGPLFYRNWINSASLSLRKRMVTSQMIWLIHYFDNNTYGYNFLNFIESLDNPSDPNALIDELCDLLYPREKTQAQKDYFKNILIPGLPDFEWTVEYGDYLADPTNEDLQQTVEAKLRSMITAMMDVPEFHLS